MKFGASAIIALLNDVLIVFAAYSIGRLSVGGTFIACMLTIIGYSINSTIVIFDRIRENMQEADQSQLKSIVNKSIIQTLTRSINTSLTTFIMVFVLFLMGVSSIRQFALTLMVGVVCGAFSSVCITGPLWYFMKTGFKKQPQAVIEDKSAGQDGQQDAAAKPKKKKKKKKKGIR